MPPIIQAPSGSRSAVASTSATIPLIHRASASAFSNEITGTGDLNGWDSEYYNIEDWTRAG